METKELKVQVPEGYVIDTENSTFECIKFKKKPLTFSKILNSHITEAANIVVPSTWEDELVKLKEE